MVGGGGVVRETMEVIVLIEREADVAHFQEAWHALKLKNTIRAFTDATEAMSFISANPSPKVVAVFVALSLPGAAQLVAWLDSPKPGRPVPIALTGFGDMRPVIQAHHLGLNYFLEWPIKIEDLRRALSSISELTMAPVSDGFEIHPA